MKKFLTSVKFVILCTIVGATIASCTKDDDKVVVTALSIDPATVSIKVGETKQLVAKTTPEVVDEKVITWTSSDAAIATVSETGVVTAVAKGQVNIVAKTANDIKAVCKVTVELKDPLAITFVEPETKEIKVGEKLQLQVNIMPADANQAITWESSDKSIAVVGETGEVLAMAKGDVNIKATTSNGLIATIKLTILPADYHISAEMVGKWTCVKFQIISLNDGTIYEEEDMGKLLKDGVDVAEWCKGVRDGVSYTTKEDNTIQWPVALEGGKTKTIEGVITKDDEEANKFYANYDIDSSGINFGTRQEDYKKITINWLESDKQAKYQEPAANGLDFIYFCTIGAEGNAKTVKVSHKKLMSSLK